MKNSVGLIKCILIITVTTIGRLKAQYSVTFNTYNLDMMQLNVAAIGEAYFNANLNYRAQWIGVKDAPRLYQLNTSLSLGKSNAIGAKIYQSSSGLLSYNNITGAYIYKLKLNDNNRLHFGIGASFIQTGFDPKRAMVRDYTDPNLLGNGVQRANNFDCEAAAVWYGRKITVGYAVNHLYNTSRQPGNNAFNTHQEMNLFASYTLNIGGSFELMPWLLGRYTVTSHAPIPEALVNLRYKKMLSLGAGYRYPNGQYTNLGFETKSLKIAYSFDYNFAGISKIFGTTHQVLLGFVIGEKKEKPKEN